MLHPDELAPDRQSLGPRTGRRLGVCPGHYLPVLTSMRAPSATEIAPRVGTLAGMARSLPNPHLLIRVHEAGSVLSSKIEGSSDALRPADLEATPRRHGRGARSSGLRSSARFRAGPRKNRPVALNLILEIHNVMQQSSGALRDSSEKCRTGLVRQAQRSPKRPTCRAVPDMHAALQHSRSYSPARTCHCS